MFGGRLSGVHRSIASTGVAWTAADGNHEDSTMGGTVNSTVNSTVSSTSGSRTGSTKRFLRGVVLASAVVAGAALAHGTADHDKKRPPAVVKEQKPWGIAGACSH